MMKRLTPSVLVATLFLVLLAGCPGSPRPAATSAAAGSPADTSDAAGSPADTTLAATAQICETLPPAETTKTAAVEPVPPPEPKPQPKPEPRPEPPPRPKALPRMWDYGSDNCLPCQEMSRILTPMMTEFKNKVDIRIINVYQERELTMQARIQVIPTQIFYDPEGKELFRHIGVYPRDSIVAKFKEFGWD